MLNHSRTLDRDMNALKPEIITLFKQRQQMAKWLRDHGKTREDINQKLENWSIEERSSSAVVSSVESMAVGGVGGGSSSSGVVGSNPVRGKICTALFFGAPVFEIPFVVDRRLNSFTTECAASTICSACNWISSSSILLKAGRAGQISAK